jgi:hypothetical protein
MLVVRETRGRLLVGAAVSVALLSLAGATRPPVTDAAPTTSAKTPAPVLGISYRSPGGTLAWFDPLTLKTLPGRKAPLAGHLDSWAFSSDRRMLAISGCGAPRLPSVRVVNARSMRVIATRELSAQRGCARAVTWLGDERLLALVETGDRAEVVMLDAGLRRVLSRVALPDGWVSGVGRTPQELVLVLSPRERIGAARVAVVGTDGALRVVSVDGVETGSVVDEGWVGDPARMVHRMVQPGLAIDPDGRRAFLVAASGQIARIVLDTLAVTYHVAVPRRSLLHRLSAWFFPAAQAKLVEGPQREARWLGGGAIAVSGVDYSIGRSRTGDDRVYAEPAGLVLVDTGSWTARLLEPEASGFAAAPGGLVAQGGRWDSGEERGHGPGLVGYDLAGHERWRHDRGEYRWLDSAGAYGIAYTGEGRAEIVDLVYGLVLARIVRDDRRDPFPQLLADHASNG